MTAGSYSTTSDLTASRPGGACRSAEISRIPSIDWWSVRGIGVALSDRVSSSFRRRRSFSLWTTPNRCSSSTIRSPRFLKTTSSWTIRCVPMHDVHAAFRESGDDRLLLALGPEPRERADRHGKVLHPRPERVVVLAREHGRRHEHRSLPSPHHALERRPHRELGLAVADVAAEQPVHGHPRLHVLLDRLQRDELVRRLLVRERRLERLLPRRVRRVRDTRRRARGPRSARAARPRGPSPPAPPRPSGATRPGRRPSRARARRRGRRCTSGRGRSSPPGRGGAARPGTRGRGSPAPRRRARCARAGGTSRRRARGARRSRPPGGRGTCRAGGSPEAPAPRGSEATTRSTAKSSWCETAAIPSSVEREALGKRAVQRRERAAAAIARLLRSVGRFERA